MYKNSAALSTGVRVTKVEQPKKHARKSSAESPSELSAQSKMFNQVFQLDGDDARSSSDDKDYKLLTVWGTVVLITRSLM